MTEYRRVALRLRGGRFRRLPAYSGLDSCGLIRNFKLERPVFGGRSNRALSIAFRAGDQVRAAVTVRRVGGRVVKRFPERSYAGGLVHRLRVTVSRRRFRGGRYVVTLRVRGPGAATRTARRVAFRL